MKNIDLYGNGFSINIDIPEEWNELSYKELLTLAERIFQEDFTPENALLLILEHRLSEKRIKNIPNIIEALNVEDLALNKELIQFITDAPTLTHWPLQFNSYKFCDNDFNSMTCGIFEDTELAFFNYNEEKNACNLTELISKITSTEFFKINALDQAKKNLILLWYLSCRNMLSSWFSSLYNGSESAEATGLEFTKLVHNGAGERNGTRENIRKMLLKEFLFDMDLQAKQALEINNSIPK